MTPPKKSVEQGERMTQAKSHFVCEWGGCGKTFDDISEFGAHISQSHGEVAWDAELAARKLKP